MKIGRATNSYLRSVFMATLIYILCILGIVFFGDGLAITKTVLITLPFFYVSAVTIALIKFSRHPEFRSCK